MPIHVPLLAWTYADSLETIKLLEVSMTLNGEDIWSYRWSFTAPFQQSGDKTMVTHLPLETLHQKIDSK